MKKTFLIAMFLIMAGFQVFASEKAAPSFQVKITGQGRPVIFIPGLASSGDVWNQTVEQYKKQFECHVLTLAGFAGVPAVDGGPVLERVKEDLASYIREKKLHNPVIVGHSIGGFIALMLAADQPDLPGAVIAVDSLPYLAAMQMPGMEPEAVKMQAERFRAMVASQSAEQYDKSQPNFLAGMITDPANIEEAMKWGRTSDKKTVGQAAYDMYTTDLRRRIAAVKVPVLVIGSWAALKQFMTKEQVTTAYRDQYAECTTCTVAMTETAKHFIMLDDPNALFAEIDSFLAKLSAKQ